MPSSGRGVGPGGRWPRRPRSQAAPASPPGGEAAAAAPRCLRLHLCRSAATPVLRSPTRPGPSGAGAGRLPPSPPESDPREAGPEASPVACGRDSLPAAGFPFSQTPASAWCRGDTPSTVTGSRVQGPGPLPAPQVGRGPTGGTCKPETSAASWRPHPSAWRRPQAALPSSCLLPHCYLSVCARVLACVVGLSRFPPASYIFTTN